MYEDYNPDGEETVVEYIRRKLKEELDKELKKELDRLLYGEPK